MALFSKRTPQDDERAARDKADQERLSRGGLPLGAELRLTEIRKNGHFFTSNLSVNELALTATEGIRPLGQVMGSTVYHVGWQYTPMYSSTELVTLTHAQYHARLLAISRLQQEARLLGAHGVIGVRSATAPITMSRPIPISGPARAGEMSS
ncbi:MAG: heavy metal-binding domain-containing protein [Janthinobacterium lividum]